MKILPYEHVVTFGFRHFPNKTQSAYIKSEKELGQFMKEFIENESNELNVIDLFRLTQKLNTLKEKNIVILHTIRPYPDIQLDDDFLEQLKPSEFLVILADKVLKVGAPTTRYNRVKSRREADYTAHSISFLTIDKTKETENCTFESLGSLHCKQFQEIFNHLANPFSGVPSGDSDSSASDSQERSIDKASVESNLKSTATVSKIIAASTSMCNIL